MPEFSLIVAYSKNRVIGKDSKIPWNIPGEQDRFKMLTTGNVVIMGRHTFDEIFKKFNRPLANRFTLAISSIRDYSEYGCPTFCSLPDALKFAREKFSDKNIYIAGGERLYKEAIPLVDKMYITKVELEVEGDAFFPQFDEAEFTVTEEKKVDANIPYTYFTYERKK
ncbi:dihydrofolate reductase [Treponema sp.]|uniref:dihydrofolate reductase n=1 Tax=Treponema sp. TaxID=166 RepID=UPI00298D942A|nr:dihydrofolate reductase [Treponema sp.]MCR5612151.1 dihydrofolate reductase [Treponema sp.]